MTKKWTLNKAKHKLSGDEPELNDLITSERPILMEVSIAEGKYEGGDGLSIILTPAGIPEDEEETWHFSYLLHPKEGETYAQMIEHIAAILGIKPDERVWKDGDM